MDSDSEKPLNKKGGSYKNSDSFQRWFLTINVDKINDDVPVPEEPVQDHHDDSDY